MLKITNVTDMRENLAKLVGELVKPVIIIQNSRPKAVLVSYEEFEKWQEEKENREYLAMVAKSPSYTVEDEINYNPLDVKPLI
jgi:prevent-host-death family protein